jgi:hypothetical protein
VEIGFGTTLEVGSDDIVDSVMCMAVVKIFAKAVGASAGWSGELGQRVYSGQVSWPLLACFRHLGLERCDDL